MKLFIQIFALSFGMILFTANSSLAQSGDRSGGSAPVTNVNNNKNRSSGNSSKVVTKRKTPSALQRRNNAQAVRKGTMKVKKN